MQACLLWAILIIVIAFVAGMIERAAGPFWVGVYAVALGVIATSAALWRYLHRRSRA